MGKSASIISGIVGLSLGLVLGPVLLQLGGPSDALGVPDWLEYVHRISTSIGGLGTVVALIFVVRQFNLLRQQTHLVQKNVASTLAAELYGRLDSFNRFIVEHHEVYELLDKPYPQPESPEQRSQLHHLCDLGFSFYEEIHKQKRRYDLLTPEDWDEWQKHMEHFFKKPYVRTYWQLAAHRYAQSFQEFAAEVIARLGPGVQDGLAGIPRGLS